MSAKSCGGRAIFKNCSGNEVETFNVFEVLFDLVVTAGYLVVTFGYLIATCG